MLTLAPAASRASRTRTMASSSSGDDDGCDANDEEVDKSQEQNNKRWIGRFNTRAGIKVSPGIERLTVAQNNRSVQSTAPNVLRTQVGLEGGEGTEDTASAGEAVTKQVIKGVALTYKKKNSPYVLFCDFMEPLELRDRVKSLWSTVGVVMALVGTVSFSALLSPANDLRGERDGWLRWCFAVSMSLSSLTATVGVVFITIGWAALESTATEATATFFRRYWWLIGVPAAFFIITAFGLVIGTSVAMYMIYTPGVVIITSVIGGISGIFLVGLQAYMQLNVSRLTRDVHDEVIREALALRESANAKLKGEEAV
ncbi:hypothetical protein NFJ02_26g61430 [Pycnococcus provasolii]